MPPADTPAVILQPDGAVLLTYSDGSALRIERDGGVAIGYPAPVRPVSRPPNCMHTGTLQAAPAPSDPYALDPAPK